MNYVTNIEHYKRFKNYSAKDLITKSGSICKETAFFGVCGTGGYDLYIITYNSIIRASKPKDQWSEPVTIQVDRFVDLEIIVREK